MREITVRGFVVFVSNAERVEYFPFDSSFVVGSFENHQRIVAHSLPSPSIAVACFFRLRASPSPVSKHISSSGESRNFCAHETAGKCFLVV